VFHSLHQVTLSVPRSLYSEPRDLFTTPIASHDYDSRFPHGGS